MDSSSPAWSRLLRQIVRGTAIGYTLLAGLGLQGAVMVSGIIAARVLGPEDRGNLALIVLIPTVVFQVGSLALPVALTYYIARDRHHAESIAGHFIRPALYQAILLTIITWLLAISLLPEDHSGLHMTSMLSASLVPAKILHRYGLAVLQGIQSFKAFNIMRVLPPLLYSVSLTVLLFTSFGSLLAISIFFSITQLASGALTLIIARAHLHSSEGAVEVSAREIVSYGLRSLLGTFSATETIRIDQAIIGLFLSPTALGTYVVAMAFTSLPGFVSKSIGIVAYPRIAHETVSSRAADKLRKYFFLNFAGISLLVVVLIGLVGFLVPLFFGEEFTGAVPIAQILLVSALFVNARRVLSDGLRGMGYPGLGSLAEMATWVAFLPASVLLAPSFGLPGVSAALALSSAVGLAVILGLAGRIEPSKAGSYSEA